ncbi:MAG: molybdenum cofactor cytidylyltransferase [Cellvibrionaceae bacterium]|jgi:molybdenum cofactor cytidylyltransferase
MIEFDVFAVVLAAGASSRMGTSKMALKWGESTVLETTLVHVSNAATSGVLLVTGGYRELVIGLPEVARTTTVHNENYEAGEMISSIKLALRFLQQVNQPPGGVLILPGDMPMVTTQLIDKVILEWCRAPDKIVAPVLGKQRGHPVIFPFELFSKFEALSTDASPRDLIKAHSHRLKLLPMDDPAIIIDVDTPAEYAKYRPGPTINS